MLYSDILDFNDEEIVKNDSYLKRPMKEEFKENFS